MVNPQKDKPLIVALRSIGVTRPLQQAQNHNSAITFALHKHLRDLFNKSHRPKRSFYA